MTEETKIDGMPVKNGWLMRYDGRKFKYVYYMPVEEWEQRGRDLEAIKNSKLTGDEFQAFVTKSQKACTKRRRKWEKIRRTLQ